MSANHMFSKRAITLIIGTLLVKKKSNYTYNRDRYVTQFFLVSQSLVFC